jgi:neutral amino acid transport system permease protein
MMAQLIVNGLVLGCIIALAAIGLSMVYKILGFANFAHGDFLTLGAYLSFFFILSPGIGFYGACITAIAVTALLAAVLDLAVWKPMRSKGSDRTSLMILSIGLALLIRNLIVIFFGPAIKVYPIPVTDSFSYFGLTITGYQATVIVIAAIMMIAVHHLLSRTSLGKAMRALSDDADLARISGIDVDLVVRYAWIVGTGLAAVAGIMYGLITNINPNMGWFMILPVFAAAILGGIGNPYGAVAGGLIIGLSQEISVAFLPSEYKLAVSFLIMVAVLIVKPEGVMGGRT